MLKVCAYSLFELDRIRNEASWLMLVPRCEKHSWAAVSVGTWEVLVSYIIRETIHVPSIYCMNEALIDNQSG